MSKNENQSLYIYADGSCLGNHTSDKSKRFGGYAWIMMYGEKKEIFTGSERGTTNNRMEIMAVVSALERVDSNFKGEIIITTDSEYVGNSINKWLDTWVKNGWKTSSKKDVANKDLWDRYIVARSNKNIRWVWIKGHSGHPENEECDLLARNEATKLTQPRKVKTFHT